MSKKSKLVLVALFLLLGAGVFAVPLPQNAQAADGDRMTPRATRAAERLSDNLSKVKERGDRMITERVRALQKLLGRIQNDKKLSSADKSSLSGDINTTIASLNALKSKIDADTDPATARSDVKSILTNFRIFAIYIPKIRLLITIGNLQTESSRMTTLSGKLQTLITKLQSQGKDVSSLQASLTDMNAQITAINSLLTTDKSLVSAVNTTSADPKSVFTQVRKDLATIRQDFAQIRHDIATMRDTIRIILPKGTASIKPINSSSSAQ